MCDKQSCPLRATGWVSIIMCNVIWSKDKYLAIDSAAHPMEQRYWLMDFADHGHSFRLLDM